MVSCGYRGTSEHFVVVDLGAFDKIRCQLGSEINGIRAVRGIGGTTTVLATLYVNVTVDDEETEICFFVLSDNKKHDILGMPWMKNTTKLATVTGMPEWRRRDCGDALVA